MNASVKITKITVFVRTGFLALAIGAFLSGRAAAVVSIDNTSTTTTDPAVSYDSTFLNWNDVGTISTGTSVSGGGVYLRNGWVLAPQHIGTPAGFYFNGIDYPVDTSVSAIPIVNNPGPGQTAADLILYKVNTASLPALATVNLTSATPAVGTNVLMMGFGYSRQAAESYFDTSGNATSTPPAGSYREGYVWASASNFKRWGTNIISNNTTTVNDGTGTFPSLITTFTDPNTAVSSHANDPGGAATTYEAAASPGDSGGGVFVKSGSSWLLAGLIHAIDPYPSSTNDTASAFYNANAPFSDSLTSENYSARTYISDLSQYASQINADTVPEPSSVMLLALPAAFGLLSRRKSRR
ncbi:MAG TPA: PEP-CTERM sorting domain-containing protein [Tepidisphaeraceae bacterium]|nr:PEP-CTERM sorting domain-containing protein [Tepidisphaeraceae bacterium]